MTAQDLTTPTGRALRPLRNGRYREPEVEGQIEWLLEATFAEAQRRISQRDSTGRFLIAEETLVYLLRHFSQEGKASEAGFLAKSLLFRSAPRITRWVEHGLQSGSQLHREQCIEEIQTQMFLDIKSDSIGCEFWEVKFWRCLRCRTMNAIERARRVTNAEMNPSFYVDANGDETNMLDTMPDTTIADVQANLELQEALSKLPVNQRKAVLLFAEQWSQQDIADSLGVTDRTVRNWLGVAFRSLRDYYGVPSAVPSSRALAT